MAWAGAAHGTRRTRRAVMTGEGLSIEMLPAQHGDALWIEWGGAGDRRRMLIDGGPSATYEKLRERFLGMAPEERKVDVFVITHIDLDHIDGAIRLLYDSSLGIEYGDVWFNDFRHLTTGSSDRGAMQGEFLATVIEQRGLPWNQAFGGGPVLVPPTGSLPSVRLPGGLHVVVLSPTPDALLTLRSKWQATLEDANMEPGDREEALARLEQRLGPAERGTRIEFGGDRSAANGSSIAFIAEYGDQRWLLAGDAHAEVLLSGLQRYGRENVEVPVRLAGFKLPHHGSVRNVTPELLAAVDCRRFLVSTNGSYFQHPDEACIDLVVADSDRPELVFNYRTTFTSKWSTSSPAYRAVYLDESSEPIALVSPGAEGEVPDAVPDAVDVPVGSEPAGPGDEPGSNFAETAPDVDTSVDASEPRAMARAAMPEVRVDVVHGSLDLANHPVLIGHYRATPLSGTEDFVDRRFAGRLSDRLAVGEYPDDVGTSLVVHPPRLRHPAAGVIVVGLGEYGELTPLRLMETVRVALVRHALNELDARGGSDVNGMLTLGISGVMVGATGEQGLSIASSVRALTVAVREANRSLVNGDGRLRVAYDHLQLWEQYESLAEIAFRAVRDIGVELAGGPADTDASAIVPSDDLGVGTGALENSPIVDAAERVWRRLRITERAVPERTRGRSLPPFIDLDVVISGQLARTGRVVHRVERRRLERLLAGVVGDSRPGSGIHTTLFELLLPNELKWELMAAQDIQLEVDDTTADIPWEMLAARETEQGGRSQLALRAPIVRQLGLADIRAVRRSMRPAALVIGNPPAGRRFPALPGAYAEARAVQRVLERQQFSYAVTSLCYDGDEGQEPAASTTEIETALFSSDFRIIHIAGHGLFQPDDPTRTGVVIGPDDFLTAQAFKQLEVVPDLVFLNCCHLAAIASGIEAGAIEFTRRRLNQLGASLARQLIDSGVRAVVVAGWAVEDQAALGFARTFYEQMLSGATFGEAVYQARRAAWSTSPKHSTWGAYQCYGDGGYRLPHDAGRGSTTRAIPPPLTVMEAVRRIERLLRRIEFVGSDSARDGDARTREELAIIEATARDRRWVDSDGSVPARLAQRLREALAEARAALGEHERAVAWYRAGLGAEESTMSLRAVEQLANHQDRLARQIGQRVGANDEDRERAGRLLADSIRLIELLEQLSGSGERTALRAGHHKRRAAATTGRERADAVREAADAYLAAYEQNGKRYGLLNYIQLEEIRSRIDGDISRAPALDDALAECEAGDLERGDFWAVVATADVCLTRAILDDAVDERFSELIERYTDAFESRSTALQRASTLDHLRDLADLHPTEAQADALSRLHEQLTNPVRGERSDT